eukprot:gene11008-19849_t
MESQDIIRICVSTAFLAEINTSSQRLSGLTELCLIYTKYANDIEEGQLSEEVTSSDIDLKKLLEFGDKFFEYNPALKLILDYLFFDGLSVLLEAQKSDGLLEAQKSGDLEDTVFPKFLLQFSLLLEVLTMALL